MASGDKDEWIDVTNEPAASEDDGWVDVTNEPIAKEEPKGGGPLEYVAEMFGLGTLPPEKAIPGMPLLENGQGYPGITRPLTAEDAKRRSTMEEAINKPLEELGGMFNTYAQIGLSPLQAPQQFLTGLTARVGEFKDPALLKLSRRRQGRPEAFDDALSKARDNGIFDVAQLYLREAFPDATPGDYVRDDKTRDRVKAIMKDVFPTASEFEQNVAAEIPAFLMDTVLDPAQYVGVAKRIARAGGEFSLGRLAGQTTQELLEGSAERLVQQSAAKSGLANEALRGERALLSFKAPLLPEIPLVRGTKALQAFENAATTVEQFAGVRPMLTRSGINGYDSFDLAHELAEASVREQVKDSVSMIQSLPKMTKDEMRAARFMQEYKGERGRIAAQAKGLNLPPESLQKIADRQTLWRSIDAAGNNELRQAGGRDLNVEWKPMKVSEQEEILQKLARENNMNEVPRWIVHEGDIAHDLTFSDQYDSGRKLSKASLEAKAATKDLHKVYSEWSSQGLKTNPDATKARDKIATAIQDELLAARYGIQGPALEINQDKIVLENYAQKLRAANDLRLIDRVKSRYGMAPGKIESFIESAKARVIDDRLAGVPPSVEDLRISKMSPKDFRPIDARVFDQVKAYSADPKIKVSKDGSKTSKSTNTKFYDEELFYPKSVASRVEAKFFNGSTQNANRLAQAMNWWSAQWYKNKLTSLARFGKQGVENHLKMWQAGVNTFDYLKEMQQTFSSRPDRITRLADAIPTVNETLLDMRDWKTRTAIPVSIDTMHDPEVNNMYRGMLGALHEGGWKGLKPMEVFSPKAWIETLNDNPISTGIRRIGNAWDGFAKRAYFRSLMNKGYAIEDATRMVGDHFMDFSRTTDMVRGLKKYSAFASFKTKNIESLIPLMLMKPGVTNVMNPYSGHLKRAVEHASGWSPEQSDRVDQAIPYMRHPILGPILRGNKTLADDGTEASDFMRTFFEAGLTDDQKGRVDGMLFSAQLPTNLSAAMDTLDPAAFNQTMYSPVLTAAAMAFLGYDVFKEKPLDQEAYQGTQRLVETLKILNPADWPKFYNHAVLPQLEKLMPDIKERMKYPVPEKVAQVLKLQLGPDYPSQQMRLDDLAVSQMTDLKTFGMGRMDKAQFNTLMQNLMLRDKLKREASRAHGLGLKKDLSREGRKALVETVSTMRALIRNINDNAKILADFKARMSEAQQVMDEKSRAYLYQMKPVIDEEAPAYEEEEVEAPDHSDDWEEEPMDEMIDDGRTPQSVERTNFDRNTELTQKYMTPKREKLMPTERPPEVTLEEVDIGSERRAYIEPEAVAELEARGFSPDDIDGVAEELAARQGNGEDVELWHVADEWKKAKEAAEGGANRMPQGQRQPIEPGMGGGAGPSMGMGFAAAVGGGAGLDAFLNSMTPEQRAEFEAKFGVIQGGGESSPGRARLQSLSDEQLSEMRTPEARQVEQERPEKKEKVTWGTTTINSLDGPRAWQEIPEGSKVSIVFTSPNGHLIQKSTVSDMKGFRRAMESAQKKYGSYAVKHQWRLVNPGKKAK